MKKLKFFKHRYEKNYEDESTILSKHCTYADELIEILRKELGAVLYSKDQMNEPSTTLQIKSLSNEDLRDQIAFTLRLRQELKISDYHLTALDNWSTG